MEQFDIVQNEILLKKSLGLELKKNIFIVEFHKPEDFLSINQNNKVLDNNSKISNLKLICKGSELTEGITKQLVHTEEVSDVEDYRYEKIYIDYNDEDNAFRCGFESFISAIEAQGYYWGENPIKLIERGEDTERNRVLNQDQWREAESKTFNLNNTYIFFKL